MREPTARKWSALERRVRARRLNCPGDLGDRARTVLEGIVDRTARGVEIPARAVFASELGMGLDAFKAALAELLANELVLRIQRGNRPAVYWPDFERVSAWADGTLVLEGASVLAQVAAELAENPPANGVLSVGNPPANGAVPAENPPALARGADLVMGGTEETGPFVDVDEALVERITKRMSWWRIPVSMGVRETYVKRWLRAYSLDELEYAMQETGVSRDRTVRLMDTILRQHRAEQLTSSPVVALDEYRGGMR